MKNVITCSITWVMGHGAWGMGHHKGHGASQGHAMLQGTCCVTGGMWCHRGHVAGGEDTGRIEGGY